MKVFDGFEVEEQTEDKLVIFKHFGSNGKGLIRITGNPNPDPVEREIYINKIIEPLYDEWGAAQAKKKDVS